MMTAKIVKYDVKLSLIMKNWKATRLSLILGSWSC
jgi:hypothetical protein